MYQILKSDFQKLKKLYFLYYINYVDKTYNIVYNINHVIIPN